MLYGRSFTDYYGDAPKPVEKPQDETTAVELRRPRFLLWDEALRILSEWAKAEHPGNPLVSLQRESWGNTGCLNDPPFSVWIAADKRHVYAETLESVVAKVTGRTH